MENSMKKEDIKISYDPLWNLLIEKDIKKSTLRKMTQIAPSTFTKMSRNEFVSLEVLARICLVLECGVDDVISITK